MTLEAMRKFFKYYLGMFLYKFSTDQARKIIQDNFSLGFESNSNKISWRLMRFYLAQHTSKKGKQSHLIELHKSFWKGFRGRRFHEITNKDPANVIKKEFIPLIEAAEIASKQYKFRTLIEIGSGNGQVLDYMANRMGGIFEEFIGLDLNDEQVALNNNSNQNRKLKFVCCDASEWLYGQNINNTLILTHRGVLEYFSEDMVNKLFSYLSNGNNGVLLIEPIDHHHDLIKINSSFTFGYEFSFSHNYPNLLQKNGFNILYLEDKSVDLWRTLMIFAVVLDGYFSDSRN
ncbi:MAG TPA: class I SAM-dependent methyltransferase [Candidatus Competibacter sp.]|nr:class I SAM-dependent methyltransferase [Candidatus Competibacter sp.]